MIKGVFFAITAVFADFFEKISKFYNTFKRSFFSVNRPNHSESYLDLSAANSPSIQNQNAISLKRKVFSGSSTNWLSPKVKDDCNVCGRSMIEMLGVLAIVGVLSVGGIAGYSKAMEKWKMDKTLEDLALLINEVIPYSQQFVSNEPGGNLLPIIKSLNIVPTSFDDKGTYLADAWDNKLRIQTCNPNPCWKFYYFLSDNPDLNAKFCYNIISFVQNFPQIVYRIDLNGGILLWGNSHCDKQTRCLRDLNIQQIHDYCKNLCKEDCQLQVGFE